MRCPRRKEFSVHFVKRGKTHKISIFTGGARRWLSFKKTNTLSGRQSPPLLVILEDGIVIFLLIVKDI